MFGCSVLDLYDPSVQALAGLQGLNPQGSPLFQGKFKHVDHDTALGEGDTKDWEKGPSPTLRPWDLYQQGA